jgi:hypothetical protein
VKAVLKSKYSVTRKWVTSGGNSSKMQNSVGSNTTSISVSSITATRKGWTALFQKQNSFDKPAQHVRMYTCVRHFKRGNQARRYTLGPPDKLEVSSGFEEDARKIHKFLENKSATVILSGAGIR